MRPGKATTWRGRIRWGMAVMATLAGCDASYTDLRPEGAANPVARPDGSSAADGAVPTLDAALPPDAALAGDAGSPAPDGTTPRRDAGAASEDVVLAMGQFEGRSGYSASGPAVLRRRGGALELALEDGFSVQSVPGPVVVLSTRDQLGASLDESAGDAQLGVLQADQGAQNYAAPESASNAMYAWIYCFPFRVEVARATLTPVAGGGS